MSAEARAAATVIVLRPRRGVGEAPDILMVRRARGASFMADAFVFPGGRVDDTDRVGENDAVDPLAAFRAAAARELFEEAAVRIEAKALVPLSRWITPSAEPKRFDTCFFVAVAASDTEARVDASEVTEHLWAPATELLRRHEARTIQLPPPTLRTLDELAAHVTIDAIIAWARTRPLDPIQPKLVSAGEAITIVLPWDPQYADAPGQGQPIPPSSPLAAGPARYVLRNGRFWAMK